MTQLSSMLDSLAHYPKRLFLIDSIGAMLSAFLLGVILTNFEESFGMPRTQLYFLSLIPVVFAVYSMSCYFWVGGNWRPYLKIIAIANLLYCCLTIKIVFFFSQSVTALGIAYFVGEIIVVGILVCVELRIAFSGLLGKVGQ